MTTRMGIRLGGDKSTTLAAPSPATSAPARSAPATPAPAVPAPSPARVPSEAERLEAVRARLADLDLLSLLDLLATWGYGPEEIRYASNASGASATRLIHDVVLSREPRLARVVLNLGILTPQSPLPSYFMKAMDSGRLDPALFLPFLEFLDHAVLRALVEQLYPERNQSLFPDWDLSRRRDLLLMNVRSCATLHWLFAATFPELDVRVEKVTLGREVKTGALTLGTAVLGNDAVFGRRARLPVPGRRVTLTTAEERAGSRRPWPQEIQLRLAEVVFPILATVGIDLEVNLVIAEEAAYLRLARESYLGYEKVRGGAESFRRIRLHSGYVGKGTSEVRR